MPTISKGVKQMFKEGDMVRYNPAWCSEGERKCVLVVLESNPDTKKCIIRWVNTTMTLKPTEMVDWDMIEPIGMNVKEYENA